MSLLTIHGKLGLRQSLVDGLKLMHKACSLCSEEFNEPLLTFAQMLTNDYKDVDLPRYTLDLKQLFIYITYRHFAIVH
jgi:hypothetical protein